MKSVWVPSFLVLLSMFTVGCGSTYSRTDLPLIPEKEYFQNLEKHTQRRQVYEGFNAVLDVSASLLTPTVSRGQLDHRARMYQWTEDQYTKELETLSKNQSTQTEVFLSFYTPERKHDDLHRPKTLWKIFLDVNGRRYEGKVEKMKSVLADVRSVYPHHNRWSSAYQARFNIPTQESSSAVATLTLTGPVGSTQIEF